MSILKIDSDKSDSIVSPELDENSINNRIVKQFKAKDTFGGNPQFVVTLDGVDHKQFLNSQSKL